MFSIILVKNIANVNRERHQWSTSDLPALLTAPADISPQVPLVLMINLVTILSNLN